MSNQVLPSPVDPTRRAYLVLVQPALVAMDIATTILDHVPGSNVIVVQSLADADRALISVDSFATAFLGLAPDTVRARDLAGAIRKRGGTIVFIGDEADEAGACADWTVLMRPFSTDGVVAEINRKLRHSDTCVCACEG